MTFIFSFLDHEIDDNKIADLEGKVNKVRYRRNAVRPGIPALELSTFSLDPS